MLSRKTVMMRQLFSGVGVSTLTPNPVLTLTLPSTLTPNNKHQSL